MALVQRTCAECGEEFLARTNKRFLCSQKCNDARYQRRHRQRHFDNYDIARASGCRLRKTRHTHMECVLEEHEVWHPADVRDSNPLFSLCVFNQRYPDHRIEFVSEYVEQVEISVVITVPGRQFEGCGFTHADALGDALYKLLTSGPLSPVAEVTP